MNLSYQEVKCKVCSKPMTIKREYINNEFALICHECLQEIDEDIREMESSRSIRVDYKDMYYGFYW